MMVCRLLWQKRFNASDVTSYPKQNPVDAKIGTSSTQLPTSGAPMTSTA